MTDDEIRKRLDRIEAALGNVSNLPLTSAPPLVFKSEKFQGVYQDFSGGRSDVQMEVDANSVLSEFVGLRDRTILWLTTHDRNPSDVDEFMRAHKPVALLQDLANVDKHVSLTRKPWSGTKPRLNNVRRVMQARGSFQIQMDLDGRTVTHGESTLVLTGTIVDENGKYIEDLHTVIDQALPLWESFLGALGILE
jgi:hypothetical protein